MLRDNLFECNEQRWINSQLQFKDTYLKNYSWLPKFPIAQSELKNFYIAVQNKQNKPIDANVINCYTHLWTYYIMNGRPGGAGETFLQPTGAGVEGGILPFGLGNIFNISTADWLLILLAIAAYYFITKD